MRGMRGGGYEVRMPKIDRATQPFFKFDTRHGPKQQGDTVIS